MEDCLQDINLSLRGEEEVEEQREETAEVEDGGGGEERRSGGLLDNLIHNLVSPLSPITGHKRVDEEEEKVFETSGNESSKRTKTEEDHVGGDGTGGLIKNVISNLFHSNEAQNEKKKKNEEEEEGVVKVVEENGKVKAEEKEGGGGGGGGSGGFIDNIVSHLPASLLDDRAGPTTDEASILIHSIIHD
ncbi:hypothetical protein Ddye_014912 [Dipteronia dyeriana]|uniref:Uncharacterized protein n=1 Tax=Dipteronia dyeriana TaxID=168575 RepID=A0AAD9U4L1_9ROSI|nr:hypothetical protein Ddye_014912 [Dipteronia dyeriana]